VDINKLMKQAQKMQTQMAETQARLADIELSTTAGGGVVEVTANAKQEITGLTIKPEAVDPDDVEMLEDMILGAIKEVQKLARERQEAEMSKVAGGMGLPPGMMG